MTLLKAIGGVLATDVNPLTCFRNLRRIWAYIEVAHRILSRYEDSSPRSDDSDDQITKIATAWIENLVVAKEGASIEKAVITLTSETKRCLGIQTSEAEIRPEDFSQDHQKFRRTNIFNRLRQGLEEHVY